MIRKRYNYINKTNKLGRRKYLMPCYGGRDIYNHYRKDIRKRIPSIYNIGYKQHRDILDIYNKKLSDLLLQGYDIKIPSLGYLILRKKFISSDTMNSGYNNGYIRPTHYHNTLTEGKWKPFIKFRKRGIHVKNIMYYSFKPGGNFVRKISNIFKTSDGHKRYFEL